MRSKPRAVSLAALVLAVVAFSGCAWAQTTWPTYHMDPLRNGQNMDSVEIDNPASINLIWTFPKGARTAVSENLTIVDNDDATHFSFTVSATPTDPQWMPGLGPDAPNPDALDSYGLDFRFAPVISAGDVNTAGALNHTPVKATWTFPICTGSTPTNTCCPAGRYRIMIWVPAQYTGTTTSYGMPQYISTPQAEYTVYDDNGATTIRFDQRTGGGWKLLSNRFFEFEDRNVPVGGYRVELTNLTNDTPDEIAPFYPPSCRDDPSHWLQCEYQTMVVAADAIKFVPGTGQEVYASPASAIYEGWTCTWSRDWIDARGHHIYTNEVYTGNTPVVYIGTVEPPSGDAGEGADTGAVHCINSVTPSTQTPWFMEPGTPGDPGYDFMIRDPRGWAQARTLAEKHLGTAIWQYPRAAAARGDPLTGNDVEGPIEGGIYASPTVVEYRDLSGVQQMVCLVAGMDRQIYAIDGRTGLLLWKGPGVTETEKDTNLVGTWLPVTNRYDAFGGQYRWTACDAAGAKTAAWLFDLTKRQRSGEPQGAGMGWSYSVYAWIPARDVVQKPLATDASYTITYDVLVSGSVTMTTTTVKVDQKAAVGKWAKIGASYFNVSSVVLSNKTSAYRPPVTAGDFSVAADAVMIVPETIGAFGYCTPLSNGIFSGGNAAIFAANSYGRILKIGLEASGSTADHIGRVKWIYPAVRTKLKVTGSADDDQPSLGGLAASPALDGANLYQAGFAGYVRGITNLDADVADPLAGPTQAWQYPEEDAANPMVFTSSPAVDHPNSQILIGNTDGEFLSISPPSGGSTSTVGRLNWKYPQDPNDPIQDDPYLPVRGLPLGAFRYTTAALAYDVNGMRRAWVGSDDGRIYSFDITQPNSSRVRRLWVEYDDNGAIVRQHGTAFYIEPSVLAPIRASVALDRSDNSSTAARAPTMYVGDLQGQGVLRWFSAQNGSSTWQYNGTVYKGWATQGELFSSPNISRVYVGRTSSVAVSYLFNGCSDGRVYAFSGGSVSAWGGNWAQPPSAWPFGGDPNDQGNKEEQYDASNAEIQVDIFPQDFYDLSMSTLAEHKETYGGVDYHTMPSTWLAPWIVSREMKQPSNPHLMDGQDDAINTRLNQEARRQRNYVFPSASARISGTGASEIYFEWGERINVALWNLPPLKFLYGDSDASRRSNVTFRLVNTSPGSSSGSILPVTITKMEQYTVLHTGITTTTVNTGGTNTKEISYYKPVMYSDTYSSFGTAIPVQRTYILAQANLRSTSDRPPSPGPGWVLTVTIRKKASDAVDSPTSQITIPVAKLRAGSSGGAPEPVTIPGGQNSTAQTNYREQLLGINNPLAIRDDQPSPELLAWPGQTGTGLFPSNRGDPEAHFNGNSKIDTTTSTFTRMETPLLNLDIDSTRPVAHGTSSRESRLGVMDRSATGTATYSAGTFGQRQATLDMFRIAAGELAWRGGTGSIDNALQINGQPRGVKFPWELGIGSADYPNIQKRSESFRKHSDAKDPTKTSTSLPPCQLGRASGGTSTAASYNYDDASLRPDTTYASVEVPRYQPANLNEYSDTMIAYIDSDRNGSFASGDQILGRPLTYQEAYRRFRVGLRVAPDPRIEVDEQLVDIGRAAHGLGEGLDFVAVNPDPAISQWFKRITIRNAGNVNLYNLRVDNSGALDRTRLYMIRDAATLFTSPVATPTISGSHIRSSLDPIGAEPRDPVLQVLMSVPFTTTLPGAYLYVNGYTLTKPRVGDADPTIMTVPDRRKYDSNYGGTADAATAMWGGACASYGMPQLSSALPLNTKVSVKIPVSQPIGTYQTPYLWVYADLDGDGQINPLGMEPFASPSSQLKVMVQESRMTGDTPLGSLSQIDLPLSGDFYPRVGDATPAAFRDIYTGNIHLFWSSNRMADTEFYPDWADPSHASNREFANAPWLIYRASLNGKWVQYETGQPDEEQRWEWQAAAPHVRWWDVPDMNHSPYLPSFKSGGATSTTRTQWPSLLGVEAGTTVMPWEFKGDKKTFQSVRHFSPTLAENDDVSASAGRLRTWLAWAGTANVLGSDGKVSQDHRLFYTDATHGNVASTDLKIMGIDHDPTVEKRSPSLSIFKDRISGSRTPRLVMWMFWQAGEKGKWSLLYSTNDKGPGFFNVRPDGTDNWATDTRLRMPDCLSSAGSPNAVHRVIGDTPSSTNAKDLFDVIYTGTGKLSPTPDVMLTRYAAAVSGSANPGQRAQPLPRVFGERLRRDSKYGFFTAEHLAWVRPSRTGYDKLKALQGSVFSADNVADILADHVGMQEHSAFESHYDTMLNNPGLNRSSLMEFYNMPYIWVELPKGYVISPNTTTTATTIVSATDGITPEVDEATGLALFKYADDSLAKAVLGQTIVDFSSGIVRFTVPLKETKDSATGTVRTPRVCADYTPQTWRLTTDAAVDNSPRAFIERTLMNQDANPGMCQWTQAEPPSVDRLWVLWRRAGTGIESSTIYWKTYRVGIDLSKLMDTTGTQYPPVRWKATPTGVLYVDPQDLQISGNFGPWELDRTGNRIYFGEMDERYSSLIKSGSQSVLGKNIPPFTVCNDGDGIGDTISPIEITYIDAAGISHTIKASEVSWLLECPETSLFGYVPESSVNEGSVYAFADLGNPMEGGTLQGFPASKIWVFWTTTRGGTSDLCWATISPNFAPR